MDMLGSAKKITVTKDDTLILGGSGTKDAINERCELIRESISQTTSEYEKEKLQERLAKLSGGVAIIKVGGSTETEVNERKDRVTDALNATKAAVADGIIPGGGAALLHASKSLTELKAKAPNVDHKTGIEIIEKAIRVPASAIAANAGFEGAVVVGKMLEINDFNVGFDIDGKYKNMIQSGIIDPAKVTSVCLVDAASVASLMITTEAVVAEIKEDKPAAPVGGGMGGMGGMGGGMF